MSAPQDANVTTSEQVTVMVVDDEKLIRWSITKHLGKSGMQVVTVESAEDCLRVLETHRPDVLLLDVRLPGMSGLEVLPRVRQVLPDLAVIMLTAHGTIDMAVAAIKHGAFDFLTKPFDLEVLASTVERALEHTRLVRRVEALAAERAVGRPQANLIGSSAELRGLRDTVHKVARSGASTVLIEGESGSGKEVVARAIHFESKRAERPFMAINCTSLPEHLVESELFGHERGAFTDAKNQKKGLIELADGGTLLLDEIGDMPMGAQAKLLRVLEERTFKRVGGTAELKVDVRILASTHRDLRQLVAEDRFRQDLYFRLNVMTLRVPPLRERISDLQELAEHFIAAFNLEFDRHVIGLSADAKSLLTRHLWPGNVRELRNVIERAFILEAQKLIEPCHLPQELTFPKESSQPSPASTDGMDLNRLEVETIRAALDKAGGNQTKAARLLGISRDTLRYRIKKFDLA